MNRLTEEVQLGPFASLKDKAEAVPGAFNTYECLYAHMTAVTKLKKYEDTGLEPEEVGAGLEAAIVKAQENTIRKLGAKLDAYRKATEEGRLVELPCKIGDKVFCFRNHGGVKHIHRGEISQMFFVYDEGQMKLQITVHGVARGIWGQNIFPTIEAAQAALNNTKEATNDPV